MSKDIAIEIQMFAETLEPWRNILDIGCGLRPYEQFFDRHKYTGIDIEVSGRDKDDKKPDRFFDGLNIPFENNSFDIAICTEVLEHCINPDKLLSEIYRILKKDGILFFTVPFIWGEHETPYDFRRYSSYGIRKIFEEIGFKIISFKKLTQGVKAIERLVGSEITHYKKTTDYKPNLWYNIKEYILRYMLSIVIYLWDSLYRFDRVYINNLVIAKKP